MKDVMYCFIKAGVQSRSCKNEVNSSVGPKNLRVVLTVECSTLAAIIKPLTEIP